MESHLDGYETARPKDEARVGSYECVPILHGVQVHV